MVFPAKRSCLVPAMEGVRWAFSCGTWLPSRAEWLLAVRSIQPEEKERIGQFVFARDAKAAMAGRLMIRKLVAEKLNIPWNNIRLQRTAKGKPVLAKDSLNPYPNFNFNISHQGDYAVLAAEPELQVGIDIMKTSFPGRGSIPEFFHIMKRKFTNKEWETIRSFKDEWTQLDMFYRNWALKESFIKAVGVGLGFELQRLEFDISPLNLDIGQVYKETRLFLDGEEEKEWAFEESKIDEHHFVAVALRKPDGSSHEDVPSHDDSKPAQRQFTVLTFNDLISSAVPMTPEDPSFWDCFCFTEEIPIRNVKKHDVDQILAFGTESDFDDLVKYKDWAYDMEHLNVVCIFANGKLYGMMRNGHLLCLSKHSIEGFHKVLPMAEAVRRRLVERERVPGICSLAFHLAVQWFGKSCHLLVSLMWPWSPDRELPGSETSRSRSCSNLAWLLPLRMFHSTPPPFSAHCLSVCLLLFAAIL